MNGEENKLWDRFAGNALNGMTSSSETLVDIYREII